MHPINRVHSQKNKNALPLNSIKKILADIQLPIALEDQEQKNELKEKLNKAFQLVKTHLGTGEKKNYLIYLSEIMTKYGRLCYEEHYPTCMVMMRGSLNTRLHALGASDSWCFDIDACENLTDLTRILSEHDKFTSFEDELKKIDSQAIAGRIEDKAHLLPLGYTLLWFSNALLNSDGFKPTEEDKLLAAHNEERLGKVFDLCENMLRSAGTEEANLELAELYYNGRCNASFRENPKDLETAFSWLEQAKMLNGSKQMAARIANRKFCTYYDKSDFEKAKKYLSEAINIWRSVPDKDQDLFLIANLHNNLAASLMKQNQYDAADKEIDKALEYMKSCKKNTHQYFGIYLAKKAKIKLVQNKLEEAKVLVNKSLEIYRIHSDASKGLIETAQDLLKDIQKAMN